MVKFIETKFRKKMNVSEQNNVIDDFFVIPYPVLHVQCFWYPYIIIITTKIWVWGDSKLGDTKITGVTQGLMVEAFSYKGRLG